MLYRVYVEPKEGLNNRANSLLKEIQDFLHVEQAESLRIINRYDVEDISEDIFDRALTNVFSQPPLDDYFFELNLAGNEKAFAVSFLPGQYDQRADMAASCIQLMAQVEKPKLQYACVYVIKGTLSDKDLEDIKKYIINPVDSHEVSLEACGCLISENSEIKKVRDIDGFIEFDGEDLKKLLKDMGLAMDFADIAMVQDYFKSKMRNPTETEIRVIDTYWSDHCRHTTFNTELKNIEIDDIRVKETFEKYLEIKEAINKDKPVTLMNMATMAMKYLKSQGKLEQLDESDEINACTIKVEVDVDGEIEEWLILFKNETHNHPTEIEPFGGAATCIGGAIRDPLSGRAYVYAAMRVTGAANPLEDLEDTLTGKLPQRKIVKTAADGYSSYGNQIGLPTSLLDEFYHPSYVAKRLEIGAVIGAVKRENIKREKPEAGDLILLIGGRTGRDGIGGATGSSKSHDILSVSQSGAEVQKGNAPEERKIQRLFRNSQVTKVIKKCNDFGAGGVSVAIGELADGLHIYLDRVPKKYAGLNATELAISESQERMALVISPSDLELMREACKSENLEMTVVAEVTEEPVLLMEFMGQKVVCLDRSFLDTNGADKETSAHVKKAKNYEQSCFSSLEKGYRRVLAGLNSCSKEGLIQQFDSTVGANTVLMPLGGKYQKTPIQAMVHTIPLIKGKTKTVSLMAYGFNPKISEVDPYGSAYEAVVDSVCKLIATGGDLGQIHLSFQEYFPSLKNDPKKWGLPLASLMGAFQAQLDLEMAAIGGKDSMSGSFENIDVIPTLVSFAVTMGKFENIMSPELKMEGNKLYLISPDKFNRDYLQRVEKILRKESVVSAYSITNSSIAEAAFKMAIGNRLGIKFEDCLEMEDMFKNVLGGFVIESREELDEKLLGCVSKNFEILFKQEKIELSKMQEIYEGKLEPVYPTKVDIIHRDIETVSMEGKAHKYSKKTVKKPKVLIATFPGTNCEYESAKAWSDAGAEVEIFLIRNLSVKDVEDSVNEFVEKLRQSQILFIPGGFSGGDEPDGSGKFILAFMKNKLIAREIDALLNERDGLIGGICNGFQALIKLGLLPYGRIVEANEDMATLTFNSIKRHQSSIVNIRISNNSSPWLRKTEVGEIYRVPISHGEGRIVGRVDIKNIASQYVDFEGKATDDIRFNPNNSSMAIEGMISDDGRVFGKMGHSERIGDTCYKNVPGNYDMRIFESAVEYFTKG